MNLNIPLKKHFGHNSFRPKQEEAIESVINGNDTLVIQPTGGGKSLCYQLPSLLLPGITLVISPLISLMKDQVDQLNKIGIPAAFLNSTNGEAEKRDITRKLSAGEIKLLYCSPERLSGTSFKTFLRSLKIALIAIDEAHCISQWGHDFRPSYSKLSRLRAMFPNVPIIALTATATPNVKTDIYEQLALRQPKIFMSSFDRPNLLINVKKSCDSFSDIDEVFGLNHHQGSNIIYCLARDETISLSQHIEAVGWGTVAFYHGRMPKKERQEVQEGFVSGEIKTIVATTAFGMGIDKPDVRLVVHATMPKTMENYYQEIGRAGRDGKLSKCILLYNKYDRSRWEFLIDKTTEWKKDATHDEIKAKMKSREKQKRMLGLVANYSESYECRRKTILGHFGEHHPGNCGKCDVCLS